MKSLLFFVTFDFCILAIFAWGGGGFGGRHIGGPFGEFISNATPEQREQLKKIFTNFTATKQQTQDGLRSFFEGIGGDTLIRFNEMQSQMKSFKAHFANKSATAAANLSDAAKNLSAQIQAVKDNMQITMFQEIEQIKALFNTASPEVIQELASQQHQHHGGWHHGGTGHQGGFGGRQNGEFKFQGFNRQQQFGQRIPFVDDYRGNEEFEKWQSATATIIRSD